MRYADRLLFKLQLSYERKYNAVNFMLNANHFCIHVGNTEMAMFTFSGELAIVQMEKVNIYFHFAV